MTRRPLFPVLFLLGLTVACRQTSEPSHELPLLDGRHAPDVLTESSTFEHPPATSGNRFLRGWRLLRRDGKVLMAPVEGSRLEAVQLAARPRTLVLRSEIRDPADGTDVRVWADGRELGRWPLSQQLEIPLPADLPLGRLPIDLEFPSGIRIAVAEAGFRRALPAGEARFVEDTILQTGASSVDIVRRVEPGAILIGRFRPPAGASPEQRFAVLIETDGDVQTAFEWRGGLWNRLLGGRDLEIPLPFAGGLVRIRLLAVGSGGAARWEGLRLRVAGAAAQEAPVAPPPGPKLVVVYVLDALRADHLGHLGDLDDVSPALDRLAAEGATFTLHLSVAPNTLPSTKSLFTGQAFIHRGGWKMSADGPETLAEVFAAAGYRTGAFSGNGHVGAAFGTIRGFDHNGREWIYEDLPGTAAGYNDNAERVQRAALRWLEGLAPSERAFAYLHSVNPHNPYTPPPALERRFADVEDSRIDGSSETLRSIQQHRIRPSAADLEKIRGLYAASVAYNDARIAELLDELGRRYAPGEVLLIVTSDHGEELFDHDGVLHGFTLYDEQVRIPLIFWWPGRIEPARIDHATDNLDLHETLRALVGAPPSGRGRGRSLWPLLRAAGGWDKDVHFAAASSLEGGIFMARSAHAKLIWAPRIGAGWGQGEGRGRSRDPEYFFDLVSDPSETANLAGERSLEAAWLRSRLLAWIERAKVIESGVGEEETEIDDATRANLKALGYLD
ncbi:MAG: sulfatase [Thermoanaerobaculia bacterium]